MTSRERHAHTAVTIRPGNRLMAVRRESQSVHGDGVQIPNIVMVGFFPR
jgi:hypothetical protein